ncbi:hypothetical protein [Escherichia coli]|uniref:phosphatase domain-containing protein n=1 Tax=Escherichia coli TaxID=562 RepID=UPI0033563303
MNQLYTMIKHHLETVAVNEKVYCFDFDGTLSDGSHRLHKLPTKDLHLTESWLEFNLLSKFDMPFQETIDVMNGLFASGAFIIVLTGRSDAVVEESTQWLYDARANYNVLVMRQADDNRKDTIIKEEFLRYIGLHRITAAWDDSPNVIAHFRSLGITTYQVCDYGDKLHAGVGSHGVQHKNECKHEWESFDDYGVKCRKCGKIEEIE